MITATTFATLILAHTGVTLLWDLLDPNAVKLQFGSAFRAVVALAYVIALFVLALVVVL